MVSHENTIAVLNRQVATWNVLFVKLHNYHWYVSGQQFFTLHVKFEEFYQQAALYIDSLAERVLALGGKPAATMADYLSLSSIQEAAGSENAEQMVHQLIQDFEVVITDLKSGMEAAQTANDETTSDLLLGIHTELEKHVWMLSAFSR